MIGSLDRGGTETHLRRVLPRLDKSRFEPLVVTAVAEGELAEELRADGVEVIAPWIRSDGEWRKKHHGFVRLASRAAQFTWHIVLRRPALVHFYLPSSYWVGGPISLLAIGLPRVMSRRSLNCYFGKAWVRAEGVERWLHPRMTAILGNSRPVVTQLLAEGAPRERTCLLRNGVDLPRTSRRTRETVRRTLGLAPGHATIACVANLRAAKGHEDLLRACAEIGGERPWRLLIVGKDVTNMAPQLSRLADQLGISDNVRWLGASDNVTDILAASDIGVLASHEEGFSNAILEKMAAGLPVVATDVGGNADAIEDGRTGYLVPARSPEAMAEALRRLIDDPARRLEMGERGRARVRDHFSLDRCVADYERFYEALLEGRSLTGLSGLRPEDHGL